MCFGTQPGEATMNPAHFSRSSCRRFRTVSSKQQSFQGTIAALNNRVVGGPGLHSGQDSGASESLPHALTAKYPNADRDWIWQYTFPSQTFRQIFRAELAAANICTTQRFRGHCVRRRAKRISGNESPVTHSDTALPCTEVAPKEWTPATSGVPKAIQQPTSPLGVDPRVRRRPTGSRRGVCGGALDSDS